MFLSPGSVLLQEVEHVMKVDHIGCVIKERKTAWESELKVLVHVFVSYHFRVNTNRQKRHMNSLSALKTAVKKHTGPQHTNN